MTVNRERLVLMEWIFAEGQVGLSLTYYLPKTKLDAAVLKDRLHAMPLPRGAVERVVHVQAAERWPRNMDDLFERLDVQQLYTTAILEGNAARVAEGKAADGTVEVGGVGGADRHADTGADAHVPGACAAGPPVRGERDDV